MNALEAYPKNRKGKVRQQQTQQTQTTPAQQQVVGQATTAQPQQQPQQPKKTAPTMVQQQPKQVGQDEEYNRFLNTLPDNQRLTPNEDYDTYLYWKLNGKPKNFQEALDKDMYAWDDSDNSYHGNSIAYGDDDTGYFIKPKHHDTVKYELDWFFNHLVTEPGGNQRPETPEERAESDEFRKNYVLADDPTRPGFFVYKPKDQAAGLNTYKSWNDIENRDMIKGQQQPQQTQMDAQAQQPQPIATDGNKSNQQPSMPKQEVQNLINRNLAAGNDPGKGVGRMMNQDKGAKPKKGQATDDGLEGTAPKGIKQYNDYGKIDYVQHSDSESHQNVSDRFNEANEKGLIPWNKQQESGSQGAGTDDYMDSFRSIMDMLGEDNTASASTTPTYPGYGYGYGYPGYYPSSLGDVTSMLEPYHMPTKEDLKKEKRNMAIRALGDGISAIAGMAGAINGGPNTVDATNSLTKTGRELIEKMREQRRKDYTAYLNAALKREQTNAANLRAMTQLERSREVSRRGRQTLALNVLDKMNRWQNAKDANEEKERHNKAMEALQDFKEQVMKQYREGLISAKEKDRAIKYYDSETKRLKNGKGGSKSSGGKAPTAYRTDKYKTKVDGVTHEITERTPIGSGGPSGGGRGNGGGKFENTKKLGL